jgi:hypothetical protein
MYYNSITLLEEIHMSLLNLEPNPVRNPTLSIEDSSSALTSPAKFCLSGVDYQEMICRRETLRDPLQIWARPSTLPPNKVRKRRA